ncbi:hypothetical protein RA266_27865, partial [Pseudomonas syringae pv. tagetis]|uniref:hypothetical protein n=1 Tax=Pseudomonas syringae group genomosp. 7 TaxID=251699 RepID=UPI0037705FA5
VVVGGVVGVGVFVGCGFCGFFVFFRVVLGFWLLGFVCGVVVGGVGWCLVCAVVWGVVWFG